MNFFEHQERARRGTALLVVLYVLAVIAVVAAVDLVLAAAYLFNYSELRVPAGTPLSARMLLNAVPAAVYVYGALGTLAAIFAVSGFQVLRLASGGDAVAGMVGARRLASGSADPLERRLLNVVEEMAIASGVRVPNVYVMDGEPGINAFAAGYDVSHAVVAVTRGALQSLNRDELQGVIGHEFSHILNGDMRLNIRMIGVLAGIVFIGSIGEFAMRGAGRSRGRGTGGLFMAGLALFVIGYVGLFFAQMIKAAISRQREFLADASSVQFTRNPDGMAGALDQIGQPAGGALIANRYAEDMSHMYFGKSAPALFDTHPPLAERIRRVNPRFEAHEYRRTRAPASLVAEEPAAAPAAVTELRGRAGRRAGDQANAWGRTARAAVALVGALDGAKLGVAQRLMRTLPARLQAQLADPQGARAALIALMLAPEPALQAQLAALRSAGAGALAEAARDLAPEAAGLAPALRLPAIDLALPALKAGSPGAKQQLLSALEAVIRADQRVSLHEFSVLELVRSQLAPAPRPVAQRATLASLGEEAATLLALLAQAGRGGRDADSGTRAFAAGVKEMGLDDLAAPGRERLTLEAAAAALEALKRLAPLHKALLVKGLFAAATADATISVSEAELLRLVGAVLDCPLPPSLEEATSSS